MSTELQLPPDEEVDELELEPEGDYLPVRSGPRRGSSRASRTLSKIAAILGRDPAEPLVKKPKREPPPLKMISGSFTVGRDNAVWYWLKIDPIKAYDHKRSRLKVAYSEKLSRIVSSLPDLPADEFMMFGLSSDVNPKEADAQWKSHIVRNASDELRELNHSHRRRMRRQLRTARFQQREVYFGLKLEDNRSLIERVGVLVAEKWSGDAVKAFGDLDKLFQKQVDDLHTLFSSHGIETSVITQEELVTAFLRTVLRGHKELPELGIDHRFPVTEWVDLIRLSDGEVDVNDEQKCLEFDYLGEKTYVSHLAVAKLPKKPAFEWLFQADEQGRPIEFSMRCRVRNAEAVEGDANRAQSIMEADYQALVGQKNTTAAEDEIKRRYWLNRDLLEYTASGGHVVFADTMLILSAPNPEKLQRLRKEVMERNRSLKLYFHVDMERQGDMWLSSIPGHTRRYTPHNHWFKAAVFGRSLPYATSWFGNGGALLGRVLGEELTPLLYSHHLAIKKENDASIAQVIIAPLGKGKTFSLLTMAATAAKDGHIAIVDENKGDTLTLGTIPLVKVSHFDVTRWAGSLNPGTLGETREEKYDLMLDTLSRCSRGLQDSWEIWLSNEINNELDRSPERPDLYRIVNELMKHPQGSDPWKLGASLKPISQSEYAPLIFSNDHSWKDIADSFKPGVITLMRYGGMKVPESKNASRSDYSNSEVLAILARRLNNYLVNRVAGDRDQPVSLFRDEFHADARLGGTTFIEYVSRTGRSLSTLVTLATQSFDDIPDQFWEFVATLIVLGIEGDSETALRAAKRLRLDIDEPGRRNYYIEELLGLGGEGERKRQGEAYMRIPGATAKVQFDDLHLEKAFVSNRDAQLALEAAMSAVTSSEEEAGFIGRPNNRADAFVIAVRLGLEFFGLKPHEIQEDDIAAWAALNHFLNGLMALHEDEVLWMHEGRLFHGKALSTTDMELASS